MNAAVEHIIELIDKLPEEDLESLERRLAERAEAAWRKEVESARAKAKADGIDDEAIQEAINRRRYGG